jgi:hypothetical protein
LSHGGVFDQKGSCIFSDFFEPEYLLGILSSTFLKYLVKSFINHGVDAQLNDLPIVIPTASERKQVIRVVTDIVAAQKKNSAYDFRPKLVELDKLVCSLYDLSQSEMAEINSWYRRRYPALFKGTCQRRSKNTSTGRSKNASRPGFDRLGSALRRTKQAASERTSVAPKRARRLAVILHETGFAATKRANRKAGGALF